MKVFIFGIFFLLGILNISCKDSESNSGFFPPQQDKIEYYINVSEISKYEVFVSGLEDIHSYRIPSLVCSKAGTLILACEARHKTYRDKSPTDVVVKRSEDNGETWSEMQFLTNQSGSEAFMDPTAVVDHVSGRIYLFMTRWVDNISTNTLPFMTYSDDDGMTWESIKNISSQFNINNEYLIGFGPGAGFQISSGKYEGRLIVPTRNLNSEGKGEFRALYIDACDSIWKMGNGQTPASELQMAEVSGGQIIMNMRRVGGVRYISKSNDGGEYWTASYPDSKLKVASKGCQGSVLGNDSVLFFTSPEGIPESDGNDERANFLIWRSLDGGNTWAHNYSLYPKAAGYSCMAFLPDGSLAIVFETAETMGFTRSATRSEGWMRLDVMVLPKDIQVSNTWIK